MIFFIKKFDITYAWEQACKNKNKKIRIALILSHLGRNEFDYPAGKVLQFFE